jgi:hypothetical protein
VPANAGGFGDVTKATDAFFELEIAPLQTVFLELNEALAGTSSASASAPARRPDLPPLTTNKGGSSGRPFAAHDCCAPCQPTASHRPALSPGEPQQIRRPAAPGPALGAATPQNALFPRLARALFVSVLMHPPMRKMAGFLGRAGVI